MKVQQAGLHGRKISGRPLLLGDSLIRRSAAENPTSHHACPLWASPTQHVLCVRSLMNSFVHPLLIMMFSRAARLTFTRNGKSSYRSAMSRRCLGIQSPPQWWSNSL